MAMRTRRNGHRPDDALVDLSHDEHMRVLDDYARRFLGMSIDEFIERLHANELPDSFAVADLKTMTGASAAGT